MFKGLAARAGMEAMVYYADNAPGGECQLKSWWPAIQKMIQARICTLLLLPCIPGTRVKVARCAGVVDEKMIAPAGILTIVCGVQDQKHGMDRVTKTYLKSSDNYGLGCQRVSEAFLPYNYDDKLSVIQKLRDTALPVGATVPFRDEVSFSLVTRLHRYGAQ